MGIAIGGKRLYSLHFVGDQVIKRDIQYMLWKLDEDYRSWGDDYNPYLSSSSIIRI